MKQDANEVFDRYFLNHSDSFSGFDTYSSCDACLLPLSHQQAALETVRECRGDSILFSAKVFTYVRNQQNCERLRRRNLFCRAVPQRWSSACCSASPALDR